MKGSLATYWRSLAKGTRNSLLDRLLLVLLIPFSLAYAVAQKLRARLYQIGILSSKRLPCPVISIGNLTVGGTGKTPVTAYIAHKLLAQGLKVAVLSRGYGGGREGQITIVSDGSTIFCTAEECGDEPFLLATTVPGLMVVTGSNRHDSGLLAMEQLDPDVFLLDDGFQHLALRRNLDIVLFDSSHPVGNGWTLPAGMLREPLSAAKRADLLILTRCKPNSVTASPIPDKPCLRAQHKLAEAIPLSGTNSHTLEELRGRTCMAFAGIAEPEHFFSGLESHGLNIITRLPLSDHAVYDKNCLAELSAAFVASGAEWAITTEKDGVKLAQLPTAMANKTMLVRMHIEFDHAEIIDSALSRLAICKTS